MFLELDFTNISLALIVEDTVNFMIFHEDLLAKIYASNIFVEYKYYKFYLTTQ